MKGICARGGYIIDMEWKDGKVTDYRIRQRGQKKGTPVKVIVNGEAKTVTPIAG